MKRRHFLALAAAAVAAHVGTARAEAYPTKPIKLIVPFAPEGSTDVIARIISEPLWRQLG